MFDLIPVLLRHLGDHDYQAGISSPPEVEGKTPFIRVMRVTGGDDEQELRDEPNIDFEVYANDFNTASKTAWKLRALISGLRGKTVDGITFRRSFRVSGPVPIPDNNPDIIRLLLTFEMSVKHQVKPGEAAQRSLQEGTT